MTKLDALTLDSSDGITVLQDGDVIASIPTAVVDAFEAGDTSAPTRALFRGEVSFSEGTSFLDVLRFGL